ncbi:MAG: acetate--CoA ligase, partial [Gammaproteobacteria bacterium]|nr:acetate--CoA ligase [Gammaproteobacteria bacterium]
VAALRAELPELEHVLLVDLADGAAPEPGTEDHRRLMAEASDSFTTEATAAEDLALLHFTSGTTGKP